jgi:tetratricopeptide (TPR) repeat protein
MRSAIFVLIVSLSPIVRAEFSSDDALKAAANNTLPVFAKQVEDSLHRELTQKKLDDQAVIRLASLRVFARRLATLKTSPEDAKTLEWLVKHPTLGPLLLTSLSPRDNPARVLSILTALRGTFGKSIEQYPDLTVAIAVVWDTPSRDDQSPEQSTQAARDLFAHLTQNRNALRFDPQLLPWPILIYLVDSRATPQERQWALNSYRLPADPGRAYFQIRYDMSSFHSGQWGGASGQPYTLANIQRLGGVCKDQAHFTAEVCRAYGIPATVCTGASGAGEGFHAWVGLLKINQNRAVFDFDTARYPDHGFWSGTVIDPQTGQKLADSEVAMAAEWCAVPAPRRLLSLAISTSLDLLDGQDRIKACKAALEAGPANQQAWSTLVNDCTQPQTPTETLKEVSAVIERFAVGRYDDFAYKSFTTLIASRPPEDQLNLLDRAARLFPDRPDLLADLALRKGDALQKSSRPIDALRLYDQVLEVSLRFGPLALEAIARVDAMLRPAGKMRDLTERYRTAWRKMPVPEASGYAWTTPWYIMGDRYAKTLEESGDKTGAGKVRQQIHARDLSHHDDSSK